MAESIDGARPHGVFMDETADWHPTRITINPDTGYGFIDSTEGRVELDADDGREAVKRISSAIHAAEDAASAEPFATTCVLPRSDSAAAAHRAIEEFAAEMRAGKTYKSTFTTSSTFAFHATYEDDEFYTLFDVDGRPWISIDPAKPETADSGEYADTIAPLEDL